MADTSSDFRLNAAQWLDAYGDALYRFALRRVGSADLAEDLVQETFVAALRAADQFEGRSKVQTWLTGILRNKITDHMRKLVRERKHAEQDRAAQEPAIFNNGQWLIGLKSWTWDPRSGPESREFWTMLNECAEKLPEKLRAAFHMRDIEQLAIQDICETLDITSTNLSVRLHRARLLLRECIDRNWFATGGQS